MVKKSTKNKLLIATGIGLTGVALILLFRRQPAPSNGDEGCTENTIQNCPDGSTIITQICNPDGTLADTGNICPVDPCEGIICDPGEHCDDGICIPDSGCAGCGGGYFDGDRRSIIVDDSGCCPEIPTALLTQLCDCDIWIDGIRRCNSACSVGTTQTRSDVTCPSGERQFMCEPGRDNQGCWIDDGCTPFDPCTEVVSGLTFIGEVPQVDNTICCDCMGTTVCQAEVNFRNDTGYELRVAGYALSGETVVHNDISIFTIGEIDNIDFHAPRFVGAETIIEIWGGRRDLVPSEDLPSCSLPNTETNPNIRLYGRYRLRVTSYDGSDFCAFEITSLC